MRDRYRRSIYAALLIAMAAGCDQRAPNRAVRELSWQEVKDWGEFARIISRRTEFDEVVLVTPDHSLRLAGDDARAVVRELSQESTSPVSDLVPRKIIGKLVLKSKDSVIAEIDCYEGRTFSFRKGYLRSNRDILTDLLGEAKTAAPSGE